jgi:acetyl esterase
MPEKRKTSVPMRILKWGLAGLGVVVAALAITVALVACSQDGSVRVLQAMVYQQMGGQPNSFEPASPPATIVKADGLHVRTNVRYADKYPNSFLDIWRSTPHGQGRQPTVIFMHGGGWFMGSKNWGDPLAGGGADGALDETIAILAKEGFAVVNLDYALAPDYRYPTPLIQLNEAIGFLKANAETYGLDMDQLFIMGGSAGAQFSAQYGVVLSDPAYAAALGIPPAIDSASVKGLIVFSAPLKAAYNNWRMDAMLWAYLGTQDLNNSPQARQMDIVAHVNARYPATYITDGNASDTFPEDAKAMVRALTKNGVDHVFNYYEPGIASLDHGYTGRLDTVQGKENLCKAIAFIRQRAGDTQVRGPISYPACADAPLR